MALSSPPHHALKISQPSTFIHTLPPPDNKPESPHKPCPEGTIRSVKCRSLHSANVKRKLDLNGSVDLEETAIPGLHERLSGEGVIKGSSVDHQHQKSQVDLQSEMQIFVPNKVFEEEPPLPTPNSDSILCVSSSSAPLTQCTGVALTLPIPSNPKLSSLVSPAKHVRTQGHDTECGYSPKKLALSNDNGRSPEKIVLSDSSESDNEHPLSERVIIISHQSSSTQTHSSRPRGTRDDPIVL